ncbi:MAG TPA: hypothetical protein IGS52_21940 [Oscillatoriaceae cyanobacterium M33_DOE_052]|uniref:Uncharacterized protein n=1 Tax=Planktothricoides sp. SpSt-374 TaxID=2282167 RepID=A0A7C3ZUE2_9CYAN|nr:hypothetical protein [Oscillatoriaceae cyanobacterium M33_DOE_052]
MPVKSVAEVFGNVWNSGAVTGSDREILRYAFLQERLSEEDYAAVDRLLHAIRRGWLQMV